MIALGRSLVARQLPEPAVDPGAARALADQVLADPIYRDTEPLLDRALRAIGEAFGRVLEQLTTGGAGSAVAWVILGVGVFGLLWLFRNAVGPLPRFAGPSPADATIVGEALDQRDAVAWRGEADRLAAAQAWDEALRARYRAVVADLVATGVLDDVAGTTPGEYRRRVLAAEAPGAQSFAELTDLFELVWYGPLDAGPDDYERFLRSESVLFAPLGASR